MRIAGRRSPKKFAADTEAQAQRFAVMERDDGRCRFELAVALTPGSTHFAGERVIEWDGDIAWTRCGSTDWLETAHIYRRHKLGHTMTDDGIELVHHPLVAIAGCKKHHQMFDSRQYRNEVRVPADAVRLARMLIEHTISAARDRGDVVIEVGLSNL